MRRACVDATDRNNGDVRRLTRAETDRVIDLCYGCKPSSRAVFAIPGYISARKARPALGIHRDKKLPDFATETFEKWLKRTGLPPMPPAPTAKVAIFSDVIGSFSAW